MWIDLFASQVMMKSIKLEWVLRNLSEVNESLLVMN